MASWSVTSISATPNFACSNSATPPAITLPTKQVIWDPSGNYIDDSYIYNDGSSKPVVFRTTPVYIFNAAKVPIEKGTSGDLVTNAVKVPIAIEVIGTFNLPESWESAIYTVSAFLGTIKVLESEGIRIPPGSSELKATNFSLILSNPDAAAEIPFRLSGDFSWLIELVDGEASPSPPEAGCTAVNLTRLELCWARSAAPDGKPTPTKPDDTRVNLSGIYPIALFRLFSPNPEAFSREPPNSILKWYIERAMKVIWEWPNVNGNSWPRYDVKDGASGYGMSLVGGSFRLGAWMKRQFDKVNCFDLAAISQLACAILVDEDGNELLNSRWVYQRPNGYINPGPLYGWGSVEDGKNHMECNNPFWRASYNCPSPDAPRNCLKRSSFSAHAWVEIDIDGTPDKILDATHASTENPNPDAGTRSREVYLLQTIDQEKERGNAQTNMGKGDQDGDCFLNPYSQKDRLGVTDAGYGGKQATPMATSGKDDSYEPRSLLMSARSPLVPPPSEEQPLSYPGPIGLPLPNIGIDNPAMDLPPDLRRYLSDTLNRGKSSKPPTQTFTNVAINPEALISLLTPETNLRNRQTTTSITSNVTQIEIEFEHPKAGNLEAIYLSLDVFNSYDGAIDALTSHLLTFSNLENLSSIVKPLDHTIGNFCYKTSDSIFWIHGNLLIRIHESKHDPFASPGDRTIFEMATKLDKHLDSSTDSPTIPPDSDLPIHRGPPEFINDPSDSPRPIHSPPESDSPDRKLELHVRRGEICTIPIANKDSYLPMKEAFCDDTRILLPVGANEKGDFDFFAVEPGKTEVHIFVADAKTLRPVELKAEVSVDPDTD